MLYLKTKKFTENCLMMLTPEVIIHRLNNVLNSFEKNKKNYIKKYGEDNFRKRYKELAHEQSKSYLGSYISGISNSVIIADESIHISKKSRKERKDYREKKEKETINYIASTQLQLDFPFFKKPRQQSIEDTKTLICASLNDIIKTQGNITSKFIVILKMKFSCYTDNSTSIA